VEILDWRISNYGQKKKFLKMEKVNVLCIGTGEYTTGYVHGSASDSDKSAGNFFYCFKTELNFITSFIFIYHIYNYLHSQN